MSAQSQLRRIRAVTLFFIVALLVSGMTAIPLIPELDWLLGILGNEPGALTLWLSEVREALVASDASYPFLAYGTDWLAFGHFVIALAFAEAWRDPVRNLAMYRFGMAACLLVIPYALIFGSLRGIPFFWRLVDCGFGVGGFPLMAYCYTRARALDTSG